MRVRQQEGKEAAASAAMLDSQSVKTTEVGGAERGYDGGKKINGRKRHLLVDTLGLVMAVLVTGANVDDGTAAPRLLEQVSPEDFPRLKTIFGDNKYHNKGLAAWLKQERPDWQVEVKMRVRRQRWIHPGEKTLGRGTHQRLEWSLPTAQQGLRTPSRIECGHDSSEPHPSAAPPASAPSRSRLPLPGPGRVKSQETSEIVFG